MNAMQASNDLEDSMKKDGFTVLALLRADTMPLKDVRSAITKLAEALKDSELILVWPLLILDLYFAVPYVLLACF